MFKVLVVAQTERTSVGPYSGMRQGHFDVSLETNVEMLAHVEQCSIRSRVG